MSITAERRTTLIGEYATGPDDTGSPEVQVALLSERIGNLTEHLKIHAKDFHSPPRPADAGRPPPPAARLPEGEGSTRATRR